MSGSSEPQMSHACSAWPSARLAPSLSPPFIFPPSLGFPLLFSLFHVSSALLSSSILSDACPFRVMQTTSGPRTTSQPPPTMCIGQSEARVLCRACAACASRAVVQLCASDRGPRLAGWLAGWLLCFRQASMPHAQAASKGGRLRLSLHMTLAFVLRGNDAKKGPAMGRRSQDSPLRPFQRFGCRRRRLGGCSRDEPPLVI